MITVYGADWCEDTRRSLRQLRRLSVAHQYINIDEDAVGLERAKSLNGGVRRTPTIDLGSGTAPLVEPDNDTLASALVELQMLTQDDLHERLTLQNVGDLERALRAAAGTVLVFAAGSAPRRARFPLRVLGLATALTGVSGWCPIYYSTGMSSLDGPGDRRDEAKRASWLTRV
jgi:glutaredoxin